MQWQALKTTTEIADLLADGLVNLCRSYRDHTDKIRLFQNQLKILVVVLNLDFYPSLEEEC